MNTSFRVGDLVEVLSLDQILGTLDDHGTLDGLPFMPEMVEHCGRQFRLTTLVQKSCVESAAWFFEVRAFRGGHVWILEDLRCSGSDHDGCARKCVLFWKSAWLKKAGEVSFPRQQRQMLAPDSSSRRLKTLKEPGRYFCQCTELVRATFPLSKSQKLLKCLSDVRSGAVGVLEMLWMIIRYVWWRIVLKFVPRHLVGSLTRTPASTLALKPGELVEVKHPQEIVKTLDRKGCNRGLRYDRTLNKFGGKRYAVSSRIDRMISEPTGRMLTVEGTVLLEGAMCPCYSAAFGGCPRRDFVYWREIWLKRMGGGHVSPVDPETIHCSVDQK